MTYLLSKLNTATSQSRMLQYETKMFHMHLFTMIFLLISSINSVYEEVVQECNIHDKVF